MDINDNWLKVILCIVILFIVWLVFSFIVWDFAWPVTTVVGRLIAVGCTVGVIKLAIDPD